MTASAARLPLLDLLKGGAAQLIVLHHIAAYGPLAAAAAELAPGLSAWFYDYARMAVQVFLVTGGFLAARALTPQGPADPSPPGALLPLLGRRYLRLVLPYLAALMLAVSAAALADHWLDDEMIPARATLRQWLAHLLLLQGVLGIESLSAGVWYIAIDFQLFALLAGLVHLSRRAGPRRGTLLLAATSAGALAALFGFNRDPAWDHVAWYFLASYGLGAAAWWALRSPAARLVFGGLLLATGVALIVDFRLRLLLAAAVAGLLFLAHPGGQALRSRFARLPDWLGRTSYALFLVHFPVCLLANAAFAVSGWDSPVAVALAVLLTWAVSLLLADRFHRHVERPASALRLSWPAPFAVRDARAVRRPPRAD